MVQITTAFAQFLSGRSAATLTVAPGVTTPRRFSDARREHLATRAAAGLFDFSFMGCAEIAGAASLPFLNSLQSRALDGLRPGRIAYTLLLRDDGTVLNDATVWRLAGDRYWLFIGRRGDLEHIASYAGNFDVTVRDASRQHAVIALQGAASRSIIERCFAGKHLVPLSYYGFAELDFAGSECRLARIGYSGETGYELVIADAAAPALWQALLAAGANAGLLECGFDAVDSLRIEAGHILFTRELAYRSRRSSLGWRVSSTFIARRFAERERCRRSVGAGRGAAWSACCLPTAMKRQLKGLPERILPTEAQS